MTQRERPYSVGQLAVCVLVSVSEGFDLASMGLAGPGMIKGLGLTRSAFGLVATTMMAGFFLGAAAGGSLGDRFGHRRIMVIAMAIVGMFSLLTAQAQALPELMLVRFLTGIGVGGVFPNLLVLAANSAPASRRGRAIAITNCGGSIGGLTAALLLAFGGASVGWTTFFILGAIAPVVIIPLVIAVLPKTIITGQPALMRMRTTTALFGEGRATVTILFWAANFLTAFMFYMVANWAPTLLAERGLPPPIIGGANAAMSIAAMVGALILTTLLDQGRTRLPFVLAYVGMIVAFAFFAMAASPLSAIGSMAMIGLCVMGGMLLLYAQAPMLYPLAVRSTGIGWSVAFGRLGAIVSPWTVGLALDAGLGQRDLLWLLTPVIVVAGCCAALAMARNTVSEAAPRSDYPS